MEDRVSLCIVALLLAAALSAEAQAGLTLGQTAAAVKTDGVFADREYDLATEAAGMKLGLTWTADTLFVALSAPTTGWVALGLGSDRMDSALMYIGYVTGDEAAIKVQKGAGHRHADTDAGAPIGYGMKEANGQTVLELALKASALIAKGQKTLDVILAMGSTDSFASLHKARTSLSIELSQ